MQALNETGKISFKKIKCRGKHERQISEMGRFVELWEGIWEKDERTRTISWMDKLDEQVMEIFNSVKELDNEEGNLIAEISKRKKLSAPGIINDIQILLVGVTKTCSNGIDISALESYRRHQFIGNAVTIKKNTADSKNKRFK